MKHIKEYIEFINEYGKPGGTVLTADGPGMDDIKVEMGPYGIDLTQGRTTISISREQLKEISSTKKSRFTVSGDGPGMDDIKVEMGPYGIELTQGRSTMSFSESQFNELSKM